jgi:hypothetical protein
MPAITFEIKSNSIVKTKYSKLHSEVKYGLWVGLDHKNDALHYKVVQEDGQPAMINIKDISKKIIAEIKFYEPMLKEYLKEIVDFQVAKRYFRLIRNYFYDITFPRIGDISADLLHICKNRNLGDEETFVEVRYDKTVQKSYEQLSALILATEKALGLSPTNSKYIVNAYHKAIKLIDDHLYTTQQQISEIQDNELYDFLEPERFFSFSITNPHPNDPINHKICTFQCASIKRFYIHKIINKHNALSKLDAVISTFVYLPPIEDQYGSVGNLESFSDKVKDLGKFLEQNKQGELLLPGAKEKIKETANEAVSRIIDEIKKIQNVVNREIDRIVDRIKSIF